MSMFDDIEGYPLDDPKHPDFENMAAEKADMDRKRMKEDGHEAEHLLKEAGFEVYGWVPMEADE